MSSTEASIDETMDRSHPPDDTLRESRLGEVFRRISRFALYAALVSPLLVPPSLIYPSTVFPAVFFRWMVAIASVGLLWQVLVRRDVTLARDAIFLSLLVFLAVATCSALLGDAPPRSLYGGLTRMGGVISILFTVLFYASLRTFLRGRDWVVYLGCAFIVGLSVGVIAIIQSSLPGQQLLWIPRPAGNPSGTLPNSGLLGGYLLVVLGIGLWLTTRTQTRSSRLLMCAGLILVFYAFLLPANRASFLGLLAALALGSLVAALRASSALIRLAVLGAAAALVAIVVITFLYPSNALTQAVPPLRNLALISFQHPTLVVRFDYWKAAINGFPAAPLLGAGPENFGLVFTQFHRGGVFESLASGYEDRSHNVFIEALSTTGVAGLISYIGIWITLGLALLRGYRRGTIGFLEASLIAGLGVALLLYLQMWFHELTTTIPLVALAGYVAWRADSPAEATTGGVPAVDRSRILVAALGAMVLGFFTWQHTVPVVKGAAVLASTVMATSFEEGAQSLQGSNAQEVAETAEVATIDATALLDLTRQLEDIQRDPSRLATVRTAIADADAQLDRLNRVDPKNDLWFVERGDIYVFAAQLTGEREYVELALDYYRTAAELSPRRLTPLYKIAAAQLLTGNRMGAFAAIEEAKLVDPEEGRAWAFETRLHIGSRDYEAAIASLRGAWDRGYCTTHSEIAELLDVYHQRQNYTAIADLLTDFYSLECSTQLRTREDVRFDRVVRLEYPLALLRAGRHSDALEASAVVLARFGSAEALLNRFEEDVAAGRGSVWMRHRSLGSAAKEFGGGPMAVGEAR